MKLFDDIKYIASDINDAAILGCMQRIEDDPETTIGALIDNVLWENFTGIPINRAYLIQDIQSDMKDRIFEYLNELNKETKQDDKERGD